MCRSSTQQCGVAALRSTFCHHLAFHKGGCVSSNQGQNSAFRLLRVPSPTSACVGKALNCLSRRCRRSTTRPRCRRSKTQRRTLLATAAQPRRRRTRRLRRTSRPPRQQPPARTRARSHHLRLRRRRRQQRHDNRRRRRYLRQHQRNHYHQRQRRRRWAAQVLSCGRMHPRAWGSTSRRAAQSVQSLRVASRIKEA